MDKLQMITIASSSQSFLEELNTIFRDNDIEFGKVTKISRNEDFNLDLATIASEAYKVIGVLGGIGGAAKVIEWLIEKIKGKKMQDKIVIKMGETIVEISNPSTLSEIEIKNLELKLKTNAQVVK